MPFRFHRPSALSLLRVRLLLLIAVAAVLLLRPASRPPTLQAASPASLSAADWQAVRSLLPPSQQAYLKASNTGVSDHFGLTVAVDGDTVVVGAPGESSAATGVDGDQDDNSAWAAGAVYVFVRNNGVWTQQAYLKASNTESLDCFGESVAIDGDTIVVGAYGEAGRFGGDPTSNGAPMSGAAYVFVRSGTTWTQQAYLKASNADKNDTFGWSVAVDTDTIVVGAAWESSAATGVNGDQSDNSAPMSGAAYIFARTGTTWTQQAYLKASNTGADDRFGQDVDLSGDTVVVGAWAEDSAASGVDGNGADNSAYQAGAAYVFARSSDANGAVTWAQQAYLKASNSVAYDQFGESVAVDGDTVVVGAAWEDSAATGVNGNQNDNSVDGSGAAYVFVRTVAAQGAPIWAQQAYLKASNTDESDYFGQSVAVDGETVVITSTHEDSAATGVNGEQSNNMAQDAGAAYVFARTGTTWAQQAYIKASNSNYRDYFGESVAVDGETIVVGAMWEDSSSTGVNGSQNTMSDHSGAAYVLAETAIAPPTPTAMPMPTPTTLATPTTMPAGGKPGLYMPLLVVDRAWLVVINSQGIATRPVPTSGETYYAADITLPEPLPAGGHFYFSSAPDRVQPFKVDDELVVMVNGQERLVVFATYPLVYEVPRAEITQWLGQNVVVSFRDKFGSVVGSTPVWLIWAP
jgi:hypothetical protein